MSLTTAPDASLAKVLDELRQRVYALENRRVLPRLSTGEVRFPGGIVVGPGDDPVATGGTPDPPTGLVLTPGATFDDVFVDVGWTAPAAGATVVGYDVVVAESGVGIVSADRVAGTSYRARGLKPNTTYTVTVYAVGKLGETSTGLSGNATTVADTTDPAQVTGLALTAGFRSVLATWAEVADPDVANGNGVYRVQLDTANTFATGNLRTVHVGGTIASVSDLATGTTYYVRVQAIDSSGNAGPWSATVSVTTAGVASGDLDVSIGGGNLVPNSSFESDPVNLSNYGTTQAWEVSTAGARRGVRSVRLAPPSGASGWLGVYSQWFPVGKVGGEPVAVSADLYRAAGSGSVSMVVEFRDASGTSLGSFSSGTLTLSTGAWTRAAFTATAPTGTAEARLLWRYTSYVAGTDALFIDGAQLEVGDVATAYAPKPDEILPGTVGTTQIADNAVTTPKLVAGSVVTAKLAAGAVTANELAADSVTAAKVVAGAITTDELAASAVTADKIAANTITGDKIAANTITASKLTTSELTSTTITLGTGGILRANSAGGSLYLDAAGLSLYNGADGTGTRTVFLDAATGAATFAGSLSGATGTFAGSLDAADGTFTGALDVGSGTVRIDGTDGILIRSGIADQNSIRWWDGTNLDFQMFTSGSDFVMRLHPGIFGMWVDLNNNGELLISGGPVLLDSPIRPYTTTADVDLGTDAERFAHLYLKGAESSGDRVIRFGGSYDLFVDNVGSGSAGRWWLDSPHGGEVVLGPRAGSNFLNRLRVRGAALFEGQVIPSGSGTHNLGASASRWNIVYGVSTNMSSDRRLKKYVSKLDGSAALAFVRELGHASRFQWRADARPADDDGAWHASVVAQDVQAALDAAGLDVRVVFGDDEEGGTLGVDLVPLVALLLGALAEQDRRLTALTG